MIVKFWGTRGSIPSPGPDTVRYGGNTTCVEVRFDNGDFVVVDAGSGVRGLGNSLMAKGKPPERVRFFFTHFHWDHIQGLPFFVPAYLPNVEMEFYAQGDAESIFRLQMTQPVFPVPWEKLASKKKFHRLDAGNGLKLGDVTVKVMDLFHPQNVFGFRFEEKGKAFAFCTDVEFQSGLRDEQVARFAEDADLVVYDAQYTQEEYEKGKKGWGHSTIDDACRLAKLAGAKQLGLFHHDPMRTDRELDGLVEKAKGLFPNVFACAEGQEVKL